MRPVCFRCAAFSRRRCATGAVGPAKQPAATLWQIKSESIEQGREGLREWGARRVEEGKGRRFGALDGDKGGGRSLLGAAGKEI